MTDTPSQQEIDAVGHFVEAVRELRDSRFFIEEYRSLSISTREGGPEGEVQGHFPDPDVVKGMLVPFRRVWHQRELCHFGKVAKILKRYLPEFRGFLDSITLDSRRSGASQPPWFADIPLCLRDVIDLWLNTRYHHVGASSHCGRFTRRDFDRWSESIGPVRFEFYFFCAVQEAGICFLNMLRCAESFLRRYAGSGLTPSFSLDGSPCEGVVERSTPGFTPDGSKPPSRVWRLRRRRRYDGLSHFLQLIRCSDDTLAAVPPHCASFEEFADRYGVIMQQTCDTATIKQDGCTDFGVCHDNHETVLRTGRCRKGFVARRRDGTLVWGGDYVPVLRDQYLEFREAFEREPFE